MTGSVTMGVLNLTVRAKAGDDHGGKGGEPMDRRFEDALATDVGRKRVPESSDHEPEKRPVWKLDAPELGARLTESMSANDEELADIEILPPDGQFVEISQVASAGPVTDALKPKAAIETANSSTSASLEPEMQPVKHLAPRQEMPPPVSRDVYATVETRQTVTAKIDPQAIVTAQVAPKGTEAAPITAVAPKIADPRTNQAIESSNSELETKPALRGLTSEAVKPITQLPPAPPQPADRPVIQIAPSMHAVKASENGDGRPQAMPLAAAVDNPFDITQGRIAVLGAQTAPAPAPTPTQVLGPSAASLVSAIEGDPSWRMLARTQSAMDGFRSMGANTGVSTLRIQLHPAELGMVTARLTATGEQLSIEIQVETNDARQRLASDSDAIVKALRSVGYDIDGMTIQHSASPSAHSGQHGASGRDSYPGQAQHQGESAGRGQGERGAQGRNGEGARHGVAERPAERAGGGVYI